MDKETLKNALESLDVLNDSHWTSDGAPAISAVNDNLPEGAVAKRSDITTHFPLFNRENPVTEETETPSESAPETSSESTSEAPSESTSEAEAKAQESESDEDPTKMALFEAEDALDVARVDVDEAQKRLADAQAAYARAKEDYDREHPPMTQAEIIKEHLRAQHLARAERMNSVRAIMDAAAANARAPIDRAMALRRGFGRERPQYPRRGG